MTFRYLVIFLITVTSRGMESAYNMQEQSESAVNCSQIYCLQDYPKTDIQQDELQNKSEFTLKYHMLSLVLDDRKVTEKAEIHLLELKVIWQAMHHLINVCNAKLKNPLYKEYYPELEQLLTNCSSLIQLYTNLTYDAPTDVSYDVCQEQLEVKPGDFMMSLALDEKIWSEKAKVHLFKFRKMWQKIDYLMNMWNIRLKNSLYTEYYSCIELILTNYSQLVARCVSFNEEVPRLSWNNVISKLSTELINKESMVDEEESASKETEKERAAFVMIRDKFICYCGKLVGTYYSNTFKHVKKHHKSCTSGLYQCKRAECTKSTERPSVIIHHWQNCHQELFVCCKKIWSKSEYKTHRKECNAPQPQLRKFKKRKHLDHSLNFFDRNNL